MGRPGRLGGLVVVDVAGNRELVNIERCVQPQDHPVTDARHIARRQSATPFIRALNGRSLSLCVCALFIVACQVKPAVPLLMEGDQAGGRPAEPPYAVAARQASSR